MQKPLVNIEYPEKSYEIIYKRKYQENKVSIFRTKKFDLKFNENKIEFINKYKDKINNDGKKFIEEKINDKGENKEKGSESENKNKEKNSNNDLPPFVDSKTNCCCPNSYRTILPEKTISKISQENIGEPKQYVI